MFSILLRLHSIALYNCAARSHYLTRADLIISKATITTTTTHSSLPPLTCCPDHPVPHEVRLVGHEDAGSAAQLRPDVAEDPGGGNNINSI